eukprot:gb/GECG01010634.1/.p1 GENE.gb/GECG01010634.1/~~gb/GECG01010634.1/.p1  ORF type:complete len:432 (+),score=61.17 gb/GECG01010634.1/:1-1296(+)
MTALLFPRTFMARVNRCQIVAIPQVHSLRGVHSGGTQFDGMSMENQLHLTSMQQDASQQWSSVQSLQPVGKDEYKEFLPPQLIAEQSVWQPVADSICTDTSLVSPIEQVPSPSPAAGISLYVKREDSLPYGIHLRALSSMSQHVVERGFPPVVLDVKSSASLSQVNATLQIFLERGVVPFLAVEQQITEESTVPRIFNDGSYIPITSSRVYDYCAGDPDDSLDHVVARVAAQLDDDRVVTLPVDGICREATAGMATLLYDTFSYEEENGKSFDDVVFPPDLTFPAAVSAAMNEAVAANDAAYSSHPKTLRVFCRRQEQGEVMEQFRECATYVWDFLGLEKKPLANIMAVEGRAPDSVLQPKSMTGTTNVILYNIEDDEELVERNGSHVWLSPGMQCALSFVNHLRGSQNLRSADDAPANTRNTLVIDGSAI